MKGDFELVKVCDFGVSIFLKDDLTGPRNPKHSYIGSEPWHSMEIKEAGPLTDKVDVFAYGLAIWEMLALDVPHVCHIHGSSEGRFLFFALDFSRKKMYPSVELRISIGDHLL